MALNVLAITHQRVVGMVHLMIRFTIIEINDNNKYLTNYKIKKHVKIQARIEKIADYLLDISKLVFAGVVHL